MAVHTDECEVQRAAVAAQEVRNLDTAVVGGAVAAGDVLVAATLLSSVAEGSLAGAGGVGAVGASGCVGRAAGAGGAGRVTRTRVAPRRSGVDSDRERGDRNKEVLDGNHVDLNIW